MSKFRHLGVLALICVGWLAAGCSSEIKIGAIVSETGAVATYGVSVKNGLDLALEEINAAGGYRGSPITLLYRDDATMPEIGEQVVLELIDQEGVDMIIGALSSPVTLRIAPICERKGVVLLSPTSSAPAISDAGDFIFRNYPSDILEGTSMARFAKDEGFERVVVFTLDNAFGSGLADVFTKEYESKFRSVVKTFAIPETQDSGFEEMVAEAKELDPDGVYIITYDQGLYGLLRAIDAADWDVVIMGTSSVTRSVVDAVGGAAEKLIFPRAGFDLASNDPAVVQFVEAYRQKYGQDPDIYSAHGYDALKLMVEAISNAESTHPTNVKIGMTSVKGYQGAAGLTTFDKAGDVVRYPRLFVIDEGRPLPYDQFVEQGKTLVER